MNVLPAAVRGKTSALQGATATTFPSLHSTIVFSFFLSVTLKPAKSIGFFSKSVCVRELACGFGFLCCAPVVCGSMREVFCPCRAEAFALTAAKPLRMNLYLKRGTETFDGKL